MPPFKSSKCSFTNLTLLSYSALILCSHHDTRWNQRGRLYQSSINAENCELYHHELVKKYSKKIGQAPGEWRAGSHGWTVSLKPFASWRKYCLIQYSCPQVVGLPHLVYIPTFRILRISFTWNSQTPRRIGRSGSKIIRYPFLFLFN